MQHAIYAVPLCAALIAACIASPSLAQEPIDAYPSKPVTILIPNSATSSVEGEYRLYVNNIRKNTGKAFIFEFRQGAGSTIATGLVARAKPDGYTLLAAGSPFTITPSVYPNLPYNTLRDFAPVVHIAKKPFFLLINPHAPFRNVNDYIAYARSHPGELFWGTGGAGGSTHLPGEMLHHMTKTKVEFVHFRGTRLVDLMAGRIHATVGSPKATAAFAKAGKMRVLGITSSTRSPAFPDVPTVAESGVPGYEYASWSGIIAPGKTPPAIVNKIDGIFKAASSDPAIIELLESDGAIMVKSNPAQFQKFLADETARWAKLIKETGIEIDMD